MRPPGHSVPKGFVASAIVVADALAWEGATSEDLLPAISAAGIGQLLARALLYRIVADWLADQDLGDVRAAACSRAVNLAVAAIEGDEPARR